MAKPTFYELQVLSIEDLDCIASQEHREYRVQVEILKDLRELVRIAQRFELAVLGPVEVVVMTPGKGTVRVRS